MRPPSTVLRHACALLSTVLLAALLVTASGAPPARDLRATSGSTYLCSGYAGCRNEGYSDAGYGAVNDRSYWNMYPGHNCTNYVAYRMIRAGMSAKRPFGYPGNATNWGDHLSDKVDQTPRVGAVAWWRAHDNGSGSAGHVAYVEKVTSDHIVISEDSWGGTFHWRRIDRSSYRWPTGFIHLIDRTIENTGRPRLSGTSEPGETLRTTDGTWNVSNPVIKYRWFVGSQRIRPEVGPTYTVRQADVGKRIRAKVVAKKRGWERGIRFTAGSAPVAAGEIVVAEQPTIVGTPVRGEKLTVKVGRFTPAPASVDVQWLADGEPIAGAVERTLRVGRSLAGARISVRVTAQKASYRPRTVTSEPTEPVQMGSVTITEEPSVTGFHKIGSVLTADPGAAHPVRRSTPTYQWLRDGVPIDGATDGTYRTVAGDFGAAIGVRVTYVHPVRFASESVATKRRTISAGTKMDVEARVRGRNGHRVVFTIHVDPRQVDVPYVGKATIWFDRTKRRVTFDDGRARVVYRGVAHGNRRAFVRLHPNRQFFGARELTWVDVQRP